MPFARAVELFEKTIRPVSRITNYVGVAFLVIMMAIITIDVCLRAVLNLPVLGSYIYEAIEFMMVILIFFGAAYCEIKKSNITVDLLVSQLPKKAQGVIDVVTYSLGIAFFILMAWRNFVQAHFVLEAGTIGVAVAIPLYPFYLLIGFGSAMLCFALLLNLFYTLSGFGNK